MTANLRLVTDADLPPAPTYGEPVSLNFTDGPMDLGTEERDGRRIVRMVVEDGLAHLALSPAEARQRAAELIRLVQAALAKPSFPDRTARPPGASCDGGNRTPAKGGSHDGRERAHAPRLNRRAAQPGHAGAGGRGRPPGYVCEIVRQQADLAPALRLLAQAGASRRSRDRRSAGKCPARAATGDRTGHSSPPGHRAYGGKTREGLAAGRVPSLPACGLHPARRVWQRNGNPRWWGSGELSPHRRGGLYIL